MANILKEFTYYEFIKNGIELASDKGAFTESYFDNPEHYEKLTSFARDFFKSNFNIIFKKQGDFKDLKKASRENNIPGLVKDVIDVFEGKIVGSD